MKDRDEIKELFQRELGNYEAKVDPGLWQGIQSGISASTGSSSIFSSMSIGAKVGIATLGAAALTIVSIVFYNNVSPDETSPQKEKKVILSDQENTDGKNNPIIDIADNKEVISDNSNKRAVGNDVIIDNKNEDFSKEAAEETKTENKNIDNSIDAITNANPIVNEDEIPTLNDESLISDKSNEVDQKEEKVENPEKVDLVLLPSIEEQKNQYVKFSLKVENVEEVVWDFGNGYLSTERQPEYFYEEPGSYEVKVTGRNKDQEIQKVIVVEVVIDGEFTNLPNGFSPNNDRMNDLFYVESTGIAEFQITIMDTKQQVVYQSNDINFRWNGTLNSGVPAPEGNYIYIIVAKDAHGNTINKYKQLRLER